MADTTPLFGAVGVQTRVDPNLSSPALHSWGSTRFASLAAMADGHYSMDMQLSYDQQTIDANLIDNSNLQPLVLALDTSRKYALVRKPAAGVRTGAPEGCVLLTVNDAKVSSCHLVLEFVWSGSSCSDTGSGTSTCSTATGCWMLTDGNGTKRSTNGVLVDQQRVPAQPVALRPGSRITVKSSKVTLHLELTPDAQAKVDAAAAADAELAAEAEAAEAAAAASRPAAVEPEPVAAAVAPAAQGSKAEPEPEPEPEPEERPRASGDPYATEGSNPRLADPS